jgi:hypothetical protein
MIRITFVLKSPTPVNCSEHASVKVHDVAPVYGPEIWKLPSVNTAVPLWPQQTWKSALASPAVVVPKSKTSEYVEELAFEIKIAPV